MGFWPLIKRVIKDSDILLEITDARMPDISRNTKLESMVKYYKKDFFVVFNKIDLISEEELRKLEEKNPDAFFVSGVKNIGLKKVKVALLIYAKRNGIEDLKIGIVGYPNMGKSAVINALIHRASTKVSSVAGTTKGIQWIKEGKLSILDSPGVVPFDDREATLGLMGAKNPEKMVKLHHVVFELIKNLVAKNKSSFEKAFGIKIEEGDDEYEILLKIGRKRGFLQRGGIVDENRTLYQIVRDWQAGKFKV